ncbi:extracellular calcium-sensing receptor-like [Pelobates cultripes]|uniref:Extracellular calcium-sensing receptor-like n=1 Tax=Pelobates cultripes TaxID=61616 RepID=A0AAD1RB45_PELCU|nr:extracellular calcium-sensing receptor-like [Pelobates cultripes]
MELRVMSMFSIYLFLLTAWCRDGASGSKQKGCELLCEDSLGYISSGDITLGGLFAVHLDVENPELSFRRKPGLLKCRNFHIRYYRFLLSMVYSIMEINKSPDLLPNIILGFKLYDSCYNEVRGLIGTKWILSGSKDVPTTFNYNCYKDTMPPAIIGDLTSKASIPMAWILGLFRYPQVSYGASHLSLSDKVQFPSFLRTMTSGNKEILVIAQLVKYFNWTWVGMINSDNEYGRSGGPLIQKEIEKNGGCIAFTETLPIYSSQKVVLQVVEVIKESNATVIIVYSSMENLISLMEEASSHDITDKVWIGCSSFSITSDFPRKDILTTLNGSLSVSVPLGKIPGLTEFLYSIHPFKFLGDIFIKTFWEKAFGCIWPEEGFHNSTAQTLFGERIVWCRGNERLDSIDANIYDVFNFRYTYKIHNAVYAVAHALHQMNSCVAGNGPFKNGSCANIYNHQPFQLLYYLRNVNFRNPGGETIYFDKNGDIPLYMDILNWQLYPNGSNQYVHVGSYDARSPKGQELTIDQSKIVWNIGHDNVSGT